MQEQVKDKIEDTIEGVGEVIAESSIWMKFVEFLNYKLLVFTDSKGLETGFIKIKYVLLILTVLITTTYFLRWARKLLTRHMPDNDKAKFKLYFPLQDG